MDDLTRIKGIGPKRAEELNLLGIHTFGDLYVAETDYLAATMEVSRETIEGWQAAAAEMADQVEGDTARHVPADATQFGEEDGVYEHYLTGSVRR